MNNEKRRLVFASANPNKIIEVAGKLPKSWTIVGLKDIGCFEDIPETAATLEGNALMKAQYVFEKFGVNCFADDTGLEIDALNGEPGVHSARYAGEQRNNEENRMLVLERMHHEVNRSARFRTVVCCILDGEVHYFEGIAQGAITRAPQGEQGFGYDPLFVPRTISRTFAQLSLEEKNILSHRGLAIKKLNEFLRARQ